ncbi:glutathione synthase [Pseudomonadales bacterium]|nr:glutathione synthase [Pseudomonadales bacterium]
MLDVISNAMIDDVVAEAMQLDMCFLSGPGQARQVPFTLTPTPISVESFKTLVDVGALLGRLTQALAANAALLEEIHAPLAESEPFFAELLSIHRELSTPAGSLPRIPLLLQRSDFMLDSTLGPSLVECNSIAAGMAPFGDRIQQLHLYIQQRWPEDFARYSAATGATIVPNPATSRLAEAITLAANHVRRDAKDGDTATFLMIVQEDEDNIFDQRLLERALQRRGVKTCRRTMRQLHNRLSTGPNLRLMLEDVGPIDVVYLRAGYQYQDYVAADLDALQCCDALRAVRIFIERHRVAVNATVSQQLATSKRMQQYIASSPASLLHALGFTPAEAAALKAIFVEMRLVDESTASRLQESGTSQWVMKNQGEGGGHCLFDGAIIERLATLDKKTYPGWTLMRRLQPTGREVATLRVREGKAQRVERLVSEIGIFTAHLDGEPLGGSAQDPGYVGYLVRSKPADVTEGGIHSGFGMLDSLLMTASDAEV